MCTLRHRDQRNRVRDEHTDDVKAPDIGGRFAELSDLTRDEANTLAKFIHGAHKACAHFTLHSGHELTVETYQRAVPIICRLIDSWLPKS